MAQVPTGGDINMFGGSVGAAASSIYEVVKHHLGAPASTDFDAILTKVKASATINDFHPNFRPSTLTDVNSTEHFRGFPVGGETGTVIVWHMKDKTEIYL